MRGQGKDQEAGAAEGRGAAAAGCGRAAADHLVADGLPARCLQHAYRVLGLEEAAGWDEVFAQLVLARIIEPVSKLSRTNDHARPCSRTATRRHNGNKIRKAPEHQPGRLKD
jgi:hypothetical protein